MTRDPDTRNRPTDEIDPMIPIMPREASPAAPPDALPDGGEPTTTATATASRQNRPVDTSYATEATQDTEEIVPFVPDLTWTEPE